MKYIEQKNVSLHVSVSSKKEEGYQQMHAISGRGGGVLTKKKRWHDINDVACFRQI